MAYFQFGTRNNGSSHQEKSCRRDISRYQKILSLQFFAGMNPDTLSVHLNCSPHGLKHVLAMVTGFLRLGDCSDSIGVKGGQHQGGLNLSTGYRQFIANALQALPSDGQGRIIAALTALDFRPHQFQGVYHPPHRAPMQRAVSAQYGKERLSGQQAGKQAHSSS